MIFTRGNTWQMSLSVFVEGLLSLLSMYRLEGGFYEIQNGTCTQNFTTLEI